MRLPPSFPVVLLATTLCPASLFAAGTVDFDRDIRPILAENCTHCHGPDEKERKGELRLDVRADALKEHDGMRAIVPGKPQESELITRISSTDKDEVMPPPKAKKT